MLRPKQIRSALTVLIGALLLLPVSVLAQTSSSSNYKVDQTTFSTGSQETCSTIGAQQYCAEQTAGDLAVGNTKSSNFGAYAGFNTTEEPFIEFLVTGGNIDLGTLTTSTTATTTGTFRVRAWQADGYAVTTAATPPTNGNYTMATTTGAAIPSAVGTEQFGINLRANTSPTTFGANPLQLPDATFSFGQVDAAYNTPNNYKYQIGDRIAYSTQSTSVTEYTVSYIYNISSLTPGGAYLFRHVIVATGSY